MPFKPGKSGNPSGTSASRQRLTHAFHRDVFRAWQEHGARCLDELAKNDPASFCRLALGLMPKTLDASITTAETNPVSLQDVLKQLETVSENLGYELRAKPLPRFCTIEQLDETSNDSNVAKLKVAKS